MTKWQRIKSIFGSLVALAFVPLLIEDPDVGCMAIVLVLGIAAALAGLAAGVWSGTEELETLRRSQFVFRPQRDAAACDADYAQWRRAVSRACGWIENEL